MKTGIIFDMDGTLWDPAENIAKSWTSVISRNPNPDRTQTTADDVHRIMGKTMTEVALSLFPDSEPELRDAIMKECMEVENAYLLENGGVIYNGLEETLQQLREDGWPLYIVSNCQSGYIEAFLTYYHFEQYFDDIDCFGNTGKPKKDTIRRLADRCQLDEFYYVGDIQGDYDATMAAGGRFIHAAYGFGTIGADVPRIERITELPALMKTMPR